MGTGAYLSPEHVDSAAPIDTRSDVYTLGVILLELLGGLPPGHGVESSGGSGSPKLSASSRRSGSMPHDLAMIVRRAMDPEKSRRYQSAVELAEDLRRYSRREPINARPRSITYEVGLFSQRHVALVAAGMCAAGALAVTTGFAVREAAIAVHNARIADAAREEAEAATSFLEEVLVSASPLDHGRDVLVRDIVHAVGQRLETAFEGQPRPEARAREAVGRTLYGIGERPPPPPHRE